jgi:hypothetical protein
MKTLNVGSGGICERGTGILRLIQEGEFLGQLINCPFLRSKQNVGRCTRTGC